MLTLSIQVKAHSSLLQQSILCVHINAKFGDWIQCLFIQRNGHVLENLVTVSISNVFDFTGGHDHHHKQVFNKVFHADCKKESSGNSGHPYLTVLHDFASYNYCCFITG